MAVDEQLTQRFRDATAHLENITEKQMMGGVCFMHNGNMIGGADRNSDGVGRFMFRVGKDNQSKALKRKGAQTVRMGQRTMRGMVFVDEKACTKRALNDWVTLVMKFVGELPAK